LIDAEEAGTRETSTFNLRDMMEVDGNVLNDVFDSDEI